MSSGETYHPDARGRAGSARDNHPRTSMAGVATPARRLDRSPSWSKYQPHGVLTVVKCGFCGYTIIHTADSDNSRAFQRWTKSTKVVPPVFKVIMPIELNKDM